MSPRDDEPSSAPRRRVGRALTRRSILLLGSPWAVGAAAALCLSAPPSMAQTEADLRREAEGHARAGGNIPWTAATPLAWTQFRGVPRATYSTVALTSTAVTYQIGCLKQEVRFAALATFSTMDSWVRSDIPPDTLAGPQTLRHEQTHFDLAEVLARELRRALRSARGLCPHNLSRARQVFDRLNAVSQAQNARYDLETAHGTALDAQASWSALVHARLDSLDAYADR